VNDEVDFRSYMLSAGIAAKSNSGRRQNVSGYTGQIQRQSQILW